MSDPLAQTPMEYWMRLRKSLTFKEPIDTDIQAYLIGAADSLIAGEDPLKALQLIADSLA